MKKLYLPLLFLAVFSSMARAAGPSPCYWSGSFVKCFPSGGLSLDGTTQYLTMGGATQSFRTTNGGADSVANRFAAFQYGGTTGAKMVFSADATTFALNFATANASTNLVRGAQLSTTMTTTTAGAEVQTVALGTMVGGTLATRLGIGVLGGVEIQGTATNDDAGAGKVGEAKESTQSSFASTNSTTAQYFDAVTLTLTAGDWLVSGTIAFKANTGTFASTDFLVGFGSVTGNDPTSMTTGITAVQMTGVAPTTWTNFAISPPTVRVQSDGTNLYMNGVTISSTQVIRLKGYCIFSGGQPQYKAIIHALRVR